MPPFSRVADILDYPAAEVTGKVDELVQAAPDQSQRICELLHKFRDDCVRLRVKQLTEIYTDTYDFGSTCSLYAGHQLFGDNWRRSALMAGLQRRFRDEAFSIGLEMPDHLCTILRFVSMQGDTEETRDLLDSCLAPALTKILGGMDRAANPYAAALEALLCWIQSTKTGERPE